ncbi:DotI/IcmL family type IV secretion protein [Rugamonas apoptosis]|uniref:DotI/IcmL/TraM family protein n=1 Tax=Rugamonas apoptosis TaxID=2758570 RepID=A0A7W2INI7_9BURK|nr:DotI/IcmL family type IV secretion protein [Rugamonas apoptosis]MBA5690557.1 DotI/IcmL/TraM family protein [Rugamonas apoptosis]
MDPMVEIQPELENHALREKHAEAQPVDTVMATMKSTLKHTSDAIEPAFRLERQHHFLTAIAGSSVKLNFVLVAILAASVVLNCGLGWVAVHPDRQYFATDNGRLFPLVPLSRPYQKSADVIQFGKDTLTRSFTLDFLNWRQQLEDLRPSYTRDGFAQFIDNLEKMGILDMVKGRRMNMSASVGTGVLTKDGVENGVFLWDLEMPIEIRLEGQTQHLPPQHFNAHLRIVRIPTLDNIQGIGAARLVTDPA